MSRVALLDVNVLVALFAQHHAHHEAAHAWFEANRIHGWATCPITENGVVRVLSNPAASGVEIRPADLAHRLGAFRASGDHVFWEDDISLTDRTTFRLELAAGPKQLTDVYLLGMAVRRDGRLATFDRKIPLAAVHHARDRHLTILSA